MRCPDPKDSLAVIGGQAGRTPQTRQKRSPDVATGSDQEPPICTVFEPFRLVLHCVHNGMICACGVPEVAGSENQATRWTMDSSGARLAGGASAAGMSRCPQEFAAAGIASCILRLRVSR
jgi:hypothetical protein